MQPIIEKKILVTGCGRSGSKYMSAVLRMLGYDVPHERMGRDGVSSWYMAAKSQKAPIGPAGGEYSFEHKFHLVRHPLTAIPSMCSLTDESWRFICQHIPCDFNEPKMLRSAKYWYFWNCLAEEEAECLLKVEDAAQICNSITRQLDAQVDINILRNLPNNINTRRYGKFFHWLEELFLRSRMFKWTLMLNSVYRQSKSSREFGWEELEALDSRLAQLIKMKADEYGY